MSEPLRNLIARAGYAALREKLSLYGAQVINIDMRNFAFSDSYMHAITRRSLRSSFASARRTS